MAARPAAFTARMAREIQTLSTEPPPGVCAWPKDESRLDRLEAEIEGPPDSPYERGVFRLDVAIPDRYPFEPPKVHYTTPIYHPNIDSAGRICLDILNMPSGSGKGAWKPSLNIPTVLQSLQLLMSEPNPDDGLMVDITHQYIHDHARFERTAREHTKKHAVGGGEGGGGSSSSSGGDDAAAATMEEVTAAAASAQAAPAAEPVRSKEKEEDGAAESNKRQKVE